MLQNLINHISLTVDKSGSMRGQPVVEVFDNELNNLKRRSVELNQETRISIYLFDDKIECLAYDMDVMRFKSLKGHYALGGQTALIDAVLVSIKDQMHLPQLYGDHAFLQYVLTDGEENASHAHPSRLKDTLVGLPPNWTTACLVPNSRGEFEAKKFGFNKDSIAIWDTNSRTGLESAGKQFSSAMDNYMSMRASGMRSTKGFFTLDTSAVRKSALKELRDNAFEIFPVRKEQPIKDFIESWTREPYRLGSAYYEPTKKVKIQNYKTVLLQDKKSCRVYEGDNLRDVLGLPDATVEVDPGKHKDWRIFVQSTSVNRKLFPDTFVLVRK